MKSLLSKIDFGNEAGDDVEFEQLAAYFYEPVNFQKFVTPDAKVAIATGKKGVGKSALIRWSEGRIKIQYPEYLVIRCRGADLARSRFGPSQATTVPNERIRDWMVRICTLANRHLASRIGIAMSDDRITAVESAELDGFKSRNLVGCLLDRLGRMIPGKGPEKKKVVDEIEILKRNKKAPRVWILIDDLDATFQNTNDELLELSTCFSALRYLTQDIKDLVFRSTLRTDVWPIIRRYDESLDKVPQYVTEIDWSREDFLGFLGKRVMAEMKRLDIIPSEMKPGYSEQQMARVYIDAVMEKQMEWAQKFVPNFQVIYTLSYQRPRWGIQVCKLAQARALQMQDNIIKKSHIDEVWGEFGTRRIADLVAEHKHQCQNINDLVTAFRGADRLMDRDTLFSWINRRIIPHVRPRIEGRDVTSAKDLANFLYRIGFIVARSESEDGYEHYSYDQMPNFLDSRTDEDFGVAWEIHPCYREALDIKKVDRSHKARFGRMRGAQ